MILDFGQLQTGWVGGGGPGERYPNQVRTGWSGPPKDPRAVRSQTSGRNPFEGAVRSGWKDPIASPNAVRVGPWQDGLSDFAGDLAQHDGVKIGLAASVLALTAWGVSRWFKQDDEK